MPVLTFISPLIQSKGTLHKKASKKDVAEARHLWIDLDPRPDKPLEAERAAMLALLTTNLPQGMPRPNRVIDSGRGYWGYWKLATPQPVDGSGPFTEAVECYGRGIEQAFGDNFADGCHNIDRIARLPGTVNTKTGRLAHVLHEHSHDEPHVIESFPRSITKSLLVPQGLISHTKRSSPSAVCDLSKFTEAPLVPADDRGVGLSTYNDDPLAWEPLAGDGGCPHVLDALRTNGAPYAQPLWHLDALLATFLRDGRRIFHRMSKGHKSYDPGDTDKMFDRKVNEKEERSLGWPGCAAIEDAGCKSCKTCPHKGKIKSPLNLTSPVATPNQKNVVGQAKQAVVAGVVFRDVTKGRARPSLANAVIAMRALGIEASYDLFHHRIKVKYNGDSKTIHDGLLTDDTVSATRSLINNTYRIDCGDANTLAAIKESALANAYDPVLNMLDDCQGKWDGVRRLDTWVIDYLGCDDTPLNRAIGRAVLIAACRRARFPGCKFDLIIVLEGVEGTNKSTAIRVLAGDENFSDQSILGAKDKEVQEQLDGVWMHENADLAGMRRAEVEHVKAFASRQVDRARPAYGRVREDRSRRSIEWGTTNNDQYLLSQTGNRRFGPLKTGKIDIEALIQDREQLLGEAATYEADGESITLDPFLWGDARDAQEQRRVADAWEDLLDPMPISVKVDEDSRTVTIIHTSGDGYDRVASADVLTYVLQVPKGQQTSAHAQRLAHAMEHLGWDRNRGGRVTINGVPVRGYIRRQDKAATVKQAPRDAALGTEKNANSPHSRWIPNKPRP
jgi:predicted P-loop ATPase